MTLDIERMKTDRHYWDAHIQQEGYTKAAIVYAKGEVRCLIFGDGIGSVIFPDLDCGDELTCEFFDRPEYDNREESTND